MGCLINLVVEKEGLDVLIIRNNNSINDIILSVSQQLFTTAGIFFTGAQISLLHKVFKNQFHVKISL